MRIGLTLAAWLGGLLGAPGGFAVAADFPAPLPVEPTLGVATLATPYPRDWAFLNYLAAERIELLDTAAPAPNNVRGALGASVVANLLQATVRPEAYVAETFFARGTRGARTDVITVYDQKTLASVGEVVLPGAKRGLFVIQPNAFQFTDHERLGLVFNFTPASSVAVVDLAARRYLGEVAIPGCALIYPTGPRGFSTLCASGTLLSVQMDADGKVVGQSETKPFNDIDNDALFSVPAVISGTSYFVSFKGRVQPIDLSGAEPKLLAPWSLVTPDEAKANWRPSGWQLTAGGPDGRLYVIMRPDGHEGTHKEGGDQVWVFDVDRRVKVATIKLKSPCQSIAVSGGARPMLLATGIGATLDRFDVATGAPAGSVPVISQGAQTIISPVAR